MRNLTLQPLDGFFAQTRKTRLFAAQPRWSPLLRLPVLAATCVLLLVAPRVLRAQTESDPETVKVAFNTDEGPVDSLAEIVVEYADGSLLLLTPDGRLWPVHEEDLESREASEAKMKPLDSEDIYEQFKAQLPPGFKVFKTRHYVIVYNTSTAYAKWTGELFERLYRGFNNYWKKRGVRLKEPRFPLVAVVFANKASYLSYAEREIGEAAKSMIGYYNMNTNRMITYDLTGINGLVPQGSRVPSSRMVNQILSQPQAERTVATIVHEAVHQIAYNSGLQVRLADNPRWLSEGLAMYFESPDFSSSAGWSMGKVNYHNLKLFAGYLRTRPANSLSTLIADDSRMLETTTAQYAYPESWALTYFLIKTRKREFTAYLRELALLPPLGETTPRERVDMFKRHFGDDLQKLDAQFIQYIRNVR